MPDERAALEDLVLRFTDAFNRDDLDGRRNEGWAAIREAFVLQFRGDYGTIRFDAEDLFVAPSSAGRGPTGKALIVTEKHTYAKAEVPLLRDPK